MYINKDPWHGMNDKEYREEYKKAKSGEKGCLFAKFFEKEEKVEGEEVVKEYWEGTDGNISSYEKIKPKLEKNEELSDDDIISTFDKETLESTEKSYVEHSELSSFVAAFVETKNTGKLKGRGEYPKKLSTGFWKKDRDMLEYHYIRLSKFYRIWKPKTIFEQKK